MIAKLLLPGFVSLICFDALADQVEARVRGYGAVRCITTIKQQDNQVYVQRMISWFRGYASGLNMMMLFAGMTMDLSDDRLDDGPLWHAVLSYCYRHPEARTGDASAEIFDNLPREMFIE